MIYLLILGIVLIDTVIFIFCARAYTRMANEAQRLWTLVHELENDKRALTESLCRAQGKPFIPSSNGRVTIPSDGWFDGKVEVKVKE